MDSRTRSLFLLLVLAQAAHSVEEYAQRLYVVFRPARFVSGLVSSDRAFGFIVLNVAVVAVGLLCWAVVAAISARDRWSPTARSIAWCWIALEIANGIAHSAMSIYRGGYFPGVLTAPLLLFCATWLALSLMRQQRPRQIAKSRSA